MADKNSSTCTRCGGKLIQFNKIVRQSANPKYPITVTQYKCTNQACQEEAEAKQAEALRIKLEREKNSKRNFGKKPSIV